MNFHNELIKDNFLQKILIRKAKLEDAALIANTHIKSIKWVYRKNIINTKEELNLVDYIKKWHQRINEKKLDIFVLEGFAKVLAFMDVEPIKQDPSLKKIGIVHRLYSDPDYMRQRPGYLIFNYVVNYFKKQKYEELFGWVAEDNHIARRFYSKMGLVSKEKDTKSIDNYKCIKYCYRFNH